MLSGKYDAENAIETLAAHAHNEQWSGWMEYLFSKCETRILLDSDLNEVSRQVCIPQDLVERWKWQMQTAYADLPESMKESDREEAQAILRALDG